MRSWIVTFAFSLSVGMSLLTCVDPLESTVNSSLNVIVVDGTITNLPEPQVIRLSYAQVDRLTGRPGSQPVTKAIVEVVVDSAQVIACQETEAGRYQLASDFKGQIGHTYQLRFTLPDDSRYESTAEKLQAVPPIDQVRAQFNPNSLTSTEQLNGVYKAAHDFYVDFTDPADRANYYRWELVDWERQAWCHTCNGGRYQITDAQGKLVEDCVNEQYSYPRFDYNCRTGCWEIIYNTDLTLFTDQYTNGNSIKALRVGRIPLYTKEHCLVEIRQTSLTKAAYAYFQQLNEQTQKTGGVAGAPPALLVGNVHNVTRRNEPVVGYFSASGVASIRYWLTRNDATGFTPGLFQALNGRDPVTEPSYYGRYRPPLAVCVSSDTRTPIKPEGWRD